MPRGEFSITSKRQMEFIDITRQLTEAIVSYGKINGLCCVFNPHTTAGLTINEGADPAVRDDLVGAIQKILPLEYPYRHNEGNSPSHLMASLMGSSVSLLVTEGRLQLGTWQKIFFCEFDGPRTRRVWYHLQVDME
ncbi:MAG: secondary thiamine-phosphate synthase enzyme YjbQ [Proteobacteria bacterium]|nr:secondary thiamine-phosphate synthase enzyme YjbQ [Pseudomonadota bacterium]MBU1687638.1 secondary thiamine-phosphate synthase enzyme YjbQ [Pseudomonadota bacterium]